jgi:hypothetical protein
MGLRKLLDHLEETSRHAVAPAGPRASNEPTGPQQKSKTLSHAHPGPENSESTTPRTGIVSINGRDVEVMHMHSPR